MTAARLVKHGLGRVQLDIMRVLWRRGRANAREITEALNHDAAAAGRPAIAHSTVQTLLRKLEAKQAVAHDVEDRTFVFFPLIAEEGVKHRATRELVERVFGGSVGGLVAYLLKEERISRREMAEIERLIRQKKT
ncbi:MAG TPA: BlaI/MecI/CopY family transcriptional regulator [Pirellulales bacterium]|nr:BlaI/MecI/CopY family transcriptional regulator [Pirellulales bacterium]